MEQTRTITKSLLLRLDAFEMWVYRRVLKISWMENDGDRPRNSETIQDQETTISRTSYQT